MTSLLIDRRELSSPSLLPENISLTRASASINFLFVDHGSSANPAALFVYNYDPKTYNTWYPPFNFRPWSVPEPASTYQDLGRALDGQRPAETQRDLHLPAATQHVQEMFGLRSLTVDPRPVREEIWLKFSKSQQQWTLYEFSYFKAIEIDKEALRKASDRLSIAWIPLVGPEFAKAVTTERFQGIPIVDNIVSLLKDPAFVAGVVQSA